MGGVECRGHGSSGRVTTVRSLRITGAERVIWGVRERHGRGGGQQDVGDFVTINCWRDVELLAATALALGVMDSYARTRSATSGISEPFCQVAR